MAERAVLFEISDFNIAEMYFISLIRWKIISRRNTLYAHVLHVIVGYIKAFKCERMFNSRLTGAQ